MKPVREWLSDWIDYVNTPDRNLVILGVDDRILDREVASGESAMTAVNERITHVQMWMNGVRPRIPLDDRMLMELRISKLEKLAADQAATIADLKAGRSSP